MLANASQSNAKVSTARARLRATIFRSGGVESAYKARQRAVSIAGAFSANASTGQLVAAEDPGFSKGLREFQLAEIGVADQLVFAEVGSPAAEHHLAGLQDIGAVGDRERHIGVLFDHEDRDTLPVDCPDDVEDLLDIGGREAHRGLVHAQELGPCHQGSAYRDHLLLTTRQGARDLAEPLLDAGKESEDALHVLGELGSAPARIGSHLEVLVDRHAGKEAARFEDRGDAAPYPFGGANSRERLSLVEDVA